MKKSQQEKILDHLQSGNCLTPLQAIRRFGCLRLGARIYDLRRSGYPIDTHTVRHNGKSYASYQLAP